MFDKFIKKFLDVAFFYILPVLSLLVGCILAYRLFDFFLLRFIK